MYLNIHKHAHSCTASTCVISTTFVCCAVDRTWRKQTVCSTGFAEMQTHHEFMYFTTSYDQITVLFPSACCMSYPTQPLPQLINLTILYLGYAMAHLVKALRYKPEGQGFDSRWCHWNFSLTQSFWQRYGPGVDSASNRNEYQKYFLGGKGGWCVRLTTLPPSCADCLEIWEPQPPGTLRACPGQ